MTDDNQRAYSRDLRGRFVKPVPEVDAESRFDPMGDSIEDIGNVSGAPSPNTIDRPRYAPDADDLAQGGQQRRLEPRTAVLAGDETAQERYGVQGAAGRAAARMASMPGDFLRFITGADHDD